MPLMIVMNGFNTLLTQLGMPVVKKRTQRMILKITPEDIKEAESILLDQGETSDPDERVPFIQNLETSDLLAVPGSGKTTALLAKLICLEKKLPFADGSGILVLAHTNAAVDEIKEKLHHISPQIVRLSKFRWNDPELR